MNEQEKRQQQKPRRRTRLQAQENTDLAVVEPKEMFPQEVALQASRFQPGQSGNPDGRGKRRMTQEQKDALEEIRAMAPRAVVKLRELMEKKDLPPAMLIRVCELILERTYGKPEAAVKVTSVAQTVEQSREYVLALVESVRQTRLVLPPAEEEPGE